MSSARERRTKIRAVEGVAWSGAQLLERLNALTLELRDEPAARARLCKLTGLDWPEIARRMQGQGYHPRGDSCA